MYTYNNPEKAMENRFALTTLATNDSLSDTV